MRSTLHRETGAAAAGCYRIRVPDLEGRADQVLDIIEFGAAHELQRRLVDEHGRAVMFDGDVIGLPPPVEIEAILEARTPSALDTDPQHRPLGFGLQDLGDAARGTLADGKLGS